VSKNKVIVFDLSRFAVWFLYFAVFGNGNSDITDNMDFSIAGQQDFYGVPINHPTTLPVSRMYWECRPQPTHSMPGLRLRKEAARSRGCRRVIFVRAVSVSIKPRVLVWCRIPGKTSRLYVRVFRIDDSYTSLSPFCFTARRMSPARFAPAFAPYRLPDINDGSSEHHQAQSAQKVGQAVSEHGHGAS